MLTDETFNKLLTKLLFLHTIISSQPTIAPDFALLAQEITKLLTLHLQLQTAAINKGEKL